MGVLKDRIHQQEDASKTLGEVLRKDAQQQVSNSLLVCGAHREQS